MFIGFNTAQDLLDTLDLLTKNKTVVVYTGSPIVNAVGIPMFDIELSAPGLSTAALLARNPDAIRVGFIAF